MRNAHPEIFPALPAALAEGAASLPRHLLTGTSAGVGLQPRPVPPGAFHPPPPCATLRAPILIEPICNQRKQLPPFAIFPQAGAAQANGEVAPGSSDNQPRDPP